MKLLILTSAVCILLTVEVLSSNVNMSRQSGLEELTNSPAPMMSSQATTTSPAPTTSQAPSEAPITPIANSPSGSPVSMPTTVLPTHNPTHIPTHAPTNAPTTPPSSRPTNSPTTAKPTRFKPTMSPTTIKPTSYKPTISPTTIKPTNYKPTSLPTTNMPTSYKPTTSPTTIEPTSSKPTTTLPTTNKPTSFKPTTSPTTNKPTSLFITASPTSAPQIDQPTMNPISLLTAHPIAVPTPAETMPPTLNLTDSPNVASSTKTIAPSLSPAASLPRLFLTGPVQTIGLKMILTGIGGIPNETEWESTTSTYYAKVYEQTYVPSTYDHKIEVTTAQVSLIDTRRSRELTTMRSADTRALQSDDLSVEVTYNQDVWYRSDDPDIDPTTAFNPLLPLSTETLRNGYIGELKTLEGFEDLTSVSEIFISSDGDGGGDGGGDEPQGLATGAIVGIAVGVAAALIILVLGLVYITRKKDDGDNSNDENPPLTELPHAQSMTSASGTGPSILQAQDNQTVASMDYDYAAAFGGTRTGEASEAGGTMGS